MGSVWTELPRHGSVDAEPVGHVRLGYACSPTARQSLDAQLDSLAEAGVTGVFSEKISTREREYIRDRTLKGHESAHKRGKTIGGAGATDDMLSMALHLRDQEMSLRDIADRLVITTGKKQGQHPSLVTVMRMPRECDDETAWRRRAHEGESRG